MPIDVLTSADREMTVEVLAQAFHDYPVFRYVLKDVDGEVYEQHLRLLIGFFVDARLMRGWPVFGIREGDELVAAMLLSDPVFMPRPEKLNRVYDALSATLGDQAIARLDGFESALKEYMPDDQTYFVGMVGVRPSSQGKGLGKVLMEHAVAMSEARKDSAAVTLTTELFENLAFYERLGFHVVGSADVGEIRTWLLMRET